MGDLSNPVQVVLLPRPLRSLMMVAQNMCDRSHFAGDIESEALVWNGQVDHAPRTHDSEKRAQCCQRVLAVLEHVICDHEVDAVVAERSQLFPVIENVN